MRFLSRGFLDMLQELKDIWDKANFLKQCLEFFLHENSLAMTKITPKNKKCKHESKVCNHVRLDLYIHINIFHLLLFKSLIICTQSGFC
jgi:hypothetical protein